MLYSFHLRGEDRTEFVWDCDADNKAHAFNKLESVYPEASVISVHDEAELAEIEEERYRQACRRMDDDDVYYDEDRPY